MSDYESYDDYDWWESNEDGDGCPECGSDNPFEDGECLDCGYVREDMTPSGDDNYQIDGVGFADPGGNSALRAATIDNPRNLPCPTCKQPDRLTPADVAQGYQCNQCADQAEHGF